MGVFSRMTEGLSAEAVLHIVMIDATYSQGAPHDFLPWG